MKLDVDEAPKVEAEAEDKDRGKHHYMHSRMTSWKFMSKCSEFHKFQHEAYGDYLHSWYKRLARTNIFAFYTRFFDRYFTKKDWKEKLDAQDFFFDNLWFSYSKLQYFVYCCKYLFLLKEISSLS